MQLPVILASIALLASTAKTCLLVDFYYEQDNNQRLYGKMKDNGKELCGIAKQGAMRAYSSENGRSRFDIIDKCEELICKDPNYRGQICREWGDRWHVTLENKIGEDNWEPRAFGLTIQDIGNDERRLTEAVWGCTWEQIDSHKGKGFPNAEVHA